jgi:hypothetical protein
MPYIVNRPDATATQAAVTRSSTISGAAQIGNIAPSKFVFFAAFDGTNNNRNDTRDANGNLTQTGDPQDTNVSRLEQQVADAKNPNVASRYYGGPGGDPTNHNGLLNGNSGNSGSGLPFPKIPFLH